MKLDTSSLPVRESVGDSKLSSWIVAGRIVETVDGSLFRVASKVASSDGVTLRLTNLDGQPVSITAQQLISMGPLPKRFIRIAGLLRFYAYNQDFDRYIKETLKKKRLPVAERMNWSKWLQANVGNPLRKHYDDETIDEAIHEALIEFLFEKKILSQFRPNVLPGTKAEQVVAYLIQNFKSQKLLEKVRRKAHELTTSLEGKQLKPGIRENVGLSMVQPGESEEGGLEEMNVLDTEEHATQSEAEDIEAWEDIGHFRKEFYRWLGLHESPGTTEAIEKLFDVVTTLEVSQAGGAGLKREDFAESWMAESGKSLAYYKTIMRKLVDSLTLFVEKHPETVDSSLFAKMIADISGKKPTTESRIEGLKSAPIAASLNLVAAAPSDLAKIPGDTGRIPHDNTGGTSNKVVVLEPKPDEEDARTVPAEIPAVHHG